MTVFRGAILIFFLAVTCLGKQIGLSDYVSHKFQTNSQYSLIHLALNNKDGKVYLSAVNRLYQLDKKLASSSEIQVTTGPVNDSSNCLPYGRACDPSELSMQNNYNKILVPDIPRNRLLICGSIYQGLCEARSLLNITQVVSDNRCKDETEKCSTQEWPLVSCLDENCTTLAVIAEGPTVNNPVLYVATTLVTSVFRDENKHSLSTRSLYIDPTKENKLFLWAVDGVGKKSYNQHINEEPYTKQFKYGFSTDGLDGFVYFLFQKIKKQGESMITTIARVCKKDVFFSSYIEMPLTCEKRMSQEESGELVGAFFQKQVGLTDFSLNHASEGALYVMYKNGTSSSLCIYTIEDLNRMFDDTIIACYRYAGKDGESGPVIVTSGTLACGTNYLPADGDQTLDDDVLRSETAPRLKYYPDYTIEKGKVRCGATYLPKALERIPEVPSTWSYHHSGVGFTGITVDLVDGINVAYIGTEEGDIIELDVNHKNNYNTIKIGQTVLSDLTMDDDDTLSVPHLYAMTSSEVFHIKVSVCERHSTCSECLGARDPYCGWCILESKCMPLSSGCSNGWLKPLSQQCIEASEPEPLERILQQDVTTKVALLPSLTSGASYQCLFNGEKITSASVDGTDPEVIMCSAPSSEELPESIEGEDYVNITLSILYNRKVNIVSTTVTFYECSAHGRTINKLQPCMSCIDNRWMNKCAWCIKSHTCQPRGGNCLTSSQSCPMVVSAAPESKLLHVGVPTDIVVNVKNFPESSSNMACHVQTEDGSSFQVSAAPVDDTRTQVRCQPTTYKYKSEQSEVPANVMVYWSPNYNLDVEVYDLVSFYNCSIEYKDCSLCVTSKAEYKCGWCGSKCVVEELCNEVWMKDPGQCPAPEIESFSPSSGPIAGNTLVTIRGTNMGVQASDVQMITVAGIPCVLQEDLYKVSTEIVCRTGAAAQKQDGRISIRVRDIEKTSSNDFHYRNPVLDKVLTSEGPVAGGIVISIRGSNLDTGSDKKVFIGTLPCEVLLPLRSGDEIECKTSPATQQMLNMTVSVEFDGFAVKLPSAFSYIENPEISSFTTASKKLASFLAGGRDVIFTGKRLQLIQNAKLKAFVPRDVISQHLGNAKRRRRSLMRKLVYHMIHGGRHRRSTKYDEFESVCKVVNTTHMTCPSPTVSLTYGDNFTKNVSDSMYAEASIRLIMDNVNLKLKNATLKYYPNPIVEDLDQAKAKDKANGTLLQIKVHNLNKDAIQDSEIVIMIGDRRCPVDSISEEGSSVHCTLPPKPDGEEVSFPVTVQMGNKLWSVGKVTYFVEPGTPKGVMIGLIVGGVVVAVIIVALTLFFCNKQKHYKETKSDFQKAIENLEMSVQADFRKAFAELSIDMTDLTADTGDVGLPILSYRQYATNMFFPSVRYHPCMKEPDPTENPLPDVQKGYIQFDLLLTNKQFLMSFIRTLEKERGFSHRDRGNVASLITVVLHKKLDYFTEVMKSLIAELVETSVQRNPKLVLRRTETVAERMFSNWLAICLFPYIRDTAGKPLFLLQKAIKHQVSKGALDAVTWKARYTLSDDSLLKEDIPCESLTLFISQSETHADEPVIVKVLSCDTISQVKEKIMDAVYKRVPFSARPKANQLDLEWRHGRSGHLVLPDSDYVNEPGSRWRRVMTIKDYKVENNGTMALIQRQQKLDDVSHFANQSADTSVVSPMLPEDVKIYHLVKYADDVEQKRESAILRDKHKHILDLYLLRLINMKGILQSYVDELFQAILDTDSIPPAVKHFFDFLDDLAKTHGIEDPEILHIWKTNSVLGRFWVTILKNPEAVFDIDKPESVESSMAVISQTFIDACSVQEHKPTKDSPINKQLYAKEIPTYKKLVQNYYQDVQHMQPVSDQDMSAHMTEISRSHNLEFDVHAAHDELWRYVNKYYEEIHETLSNDPNSTQMVIQRLQQAYTLIDSSVNNP